MVKLQQQKISSVYGDAAPFPSFSKFGLSSLSVAVQVRLMMSVLNSKTQTTTTEEMFDKV